MDVKYLYITFASAFASEGERERKRKKGKFFKILKGFKQTASANSLEQSKGDDARGEETKQKQY